MSITGHQVIDCPVCRTPIEVFLAESINGARHRHLRAAIVERRLHVFACHACGTRSAVEGELLYVDFPRRQFLGVYPRGERWREEECAAALLDAFRGSVEYAPEAVSEEARSWLVRLCFGYEELREKLVADEAGLNDLVLEALKGDLMAARAAELAPAGVVTLRLDGVAADGALRLVPEFAGPIPAGTAPGPWFVERALYDAVSARRGDLLALHPGLVRGPHVSLLRLVPWPAPSPTRTPPLL